MTEEKKDKRTPNRPQEPNLPPLDFSSIVLPFFTHALINLGKVDDPSSGKKKVDLKTAQRLIDLIDLLHKKTQGRLSPKEEKFISGCLFQLKTRYTELADTDKK